MPAATKITVRWCVYTMSIHAVLVYVWYIFYLKSVGVDIISLVSLDFLSFLSFFFFNVSFPDIFWLEKSGNGATMKNIKWDYF